MSREWGELLLWAAFLTVAAVVTWLAILAAASPRGPLGPFPT